ncbi:MAG: DUF1002 domain-containing protein [Aerococcaceae bacterium]|nr:DUF1002 domain-containing protein [Aerococcaceae bacterium]
MKKFIKKTLTLALTTGLIWNSLPVQAISTKSLSLGGSLQGAQLTQTRQLLGATDVTEANTIYIDGNTINRYLKDGSTSGTPVYSSAVIEPLPAGSGVQVQIITPQNIQLVTPLTYQNAAITSGAKDILIKIATVTPVTGEGALTGVYALLEKSGATVSPQAIQVAEKEIKIVEEVRKETTISENEMNQIIADIKKEVVLRVSNKETPNMEELVLKVLISYPNVTLTTDRIKELQELAYGFAQTEASKDRATIGQIDNSIQVDADRPYAVDLSQYGQDIWFKRDGANIPTYLSLHANEGHFFQHYADQSPIANYTVESIPTKEVRIFSADGSGIRTVKVNTLIKVQTRDGSLTEQESFHYAFVNRNGGLSLATPNYAGNVEPQDADVMLEYLVAEQPATTTTEAETPLWSADKARALDDFMITWSEQMGQSYVLATPKNPVRYFGDDMPQRGLEDFAIGEQGKLEANWSYDGVSESGYNIVATYVQTGSDVIFPIIYFFAIENGTPTVFYSQQHQGGTPENAFYFHPTENRDLAQGFADIVNNP